MFQRTYCEICVGGAGGGLRNIPSNPTSPLTRWTEAISQSVMFPSPINRWMAEPHPETWSPNSQSCSSCTNDLDFLHNRIQAPILPQLCQIWFYQYHPEHLPGKLKQLKHQHEYSPGEQTKQVLSAGRVKENLTVSDRHHHGRMQGGAIHVTSPSKCNSHQSHSP